MNAIKTGLLFTVMCYASCTKFDDRLALQNGQSGIIKIVKNTAVIGEAKIDEEITVYVKIGTPAANVKWFISGAEATITSHGQGISIIRPNNGGVVSVPMDTFNIIVPKAAKIGAGTIYFTVNEEVKPAMAFTVKRPDILIPNNVLVSPFLFSYTDSTQRPGGYDYDFPRELRDGPSGQAVVHSIWNLTYDKDTQAFYFVDHQRDEGPVYSNSLRIRKLKNGVVTTIAGGGEDYFATTGSQLKLGTENFSTSAGESLDMRPGPDGKLYFTNTFTTDPDPVTGLVSSYSLIQRIDPVTNKIETILGNNKRSVEAYPSNNRFNYRGLEDGGADSAMIGSPRALTFDKAGNLYFIDGATGVLLRKLDKNGILTTVLGQINREVYEFEDVDGKIYKPVFYTEIEENSDGFGNEVRFYGIKSMVQAGNGKFYLLRGSFVVEVNMDTKEASTVIGLPAGRLGPNTGTFKEVLVDFATTFDVDYDGNILFGFTKIYKMDLQAETVSLVAGGGDFSNGLPPWYTSQRHFMQDTHPGNFCILGRVNRIVFDQFGNLYAGYDNVAASADVRIVKIIIEK